MLTFPVTMFGGSAISSLVHTASPVLATDLTAYTFTAASIGTAAADRLVVVGVGSLNNTAARTISSLTIGGSAATADVAYDDFSGGGNFAGSGLYSLLVTSGTTADIVVTFSGAMLRCGLGVWAIYGAASATPVDTEFSDGSGTTMTPALVGEIGDAVVALIHNNSGVALRTHAWDSPLGEDFDEVVEANGGHSGASILLASSITQIGCTISGSVNARRLVAGVWR